MLIPCCAMLWTRSLSVIGSRMGASIGFDEVSGWPCIRVLRRCTAGEACSPQAMRREDSRRKTKRNNQAFHLFCASGESGSYSGVWSFGLGRATKNAILSEYSLLGERKANCELRRPSSAIASPCPIFWAAWQRIRKCWIIVVCAGFNFFPWFNNWRYGKFPSKNASYECFFDNLDKTMKDKTKFFGLYYRP